MSGRKRSNIMELKQFNTNVRTISKAGVKLDKLVHITAVGGLELVQADRNATRMDQLLKALPKGYRREAFKLWVQAHSPIRWNGDEKIGILKEAAKTYTPFAIEAADATPFWDFTVENKTVKTLSLEAILKLLKREGDKLEKADPETGEVTDDEGKIIAKVEGNVIHLRAAVQAARVSLMQAA